MAGNGESRDYYGVLALQKDCSESELRIAYKKLAMKWHPDRCKASGNQFIEEAKMKFQEIQEAYSVLSDSNKRYMYDLGLYDNGDPNDENGMGNFMREMAQMMSETNPNSVPETLEDLQDLFDEMFGDWPMMNGQDRAASNNKRSCSAVNPSEPKLDGFEPGQAGFCFGSNYSGGSRGGSNKRRSWGKQKSSSKKDLSSYDAEISA